MTVAKSCTNCVHSKFDPIWGEYKCLYYSRRIHDAESESENCPNYKYTSESKIKEFTDDECE